MKLIPFLAASFVLCSSAFAQLTPMPLPPGGFHLPLPDPVLANVSKTKSYGTLIGFNNANLKLGMKGYGSVFVVQDQTQVLGRAKTGAKAEGLASLAGIALLGAVARFDAEAANATWSHNGTYATVTSQADYSKASLFVQIGDFVVLDATSNFSGDIVSLPNFIDTHQRDIFDVEVKHTIIPLVDITVHISADAGVAYSLKATLDPLVVSGPSIGSKAKVVGAANGWVTAGATFTIGNPCVWGGLSFDFRLADSGFMGAVTAERTGVTGTITLSEQPLALLLKAVWGGWCVPNGSKTWWSWGSQIYSVMYTL